MSTTDEQLPYHVMGGDDLDRCSGGVESVLVDVLLAQSCVVGVHTDHKMEGPGYAGVTYSEGLYSYLVVLRIRKKRTFAAGYITVEQERSTRKHELTPYWWTLRVYGTKELLETLQNAQPHPDDEEEWR